MVVKDHCYIALVRDLFFRLYLLLCSFPVDGNDLMAPVFCPLAHGTDARLIAPAEPAQPPAVQTARRVLQVLDHAEQDVTAEVLIHVMGLQVGGAIRGHALKAALDRTALCEAEITGDFASFQRRRCSTSSSSSRGAALCLLRLQLWPSGETDLAEWAHKAAMDSPVFTYTAQTETVSTGEGGGAARAVQTDGALRRLRHQMEREARPPLRDGRCCRLAPDNNNNNTLNL